MDRSIKSTLRRQCLKQRNVLTESERAEYSHVICEQICQIPVEEYDAVLGYYPIGSEVDIRWCLRSCLKNQIPVFLPKTFGQEMEFYKVEDLNGLQKGAFGVLEPIPSESRLLQCCLSEEERTRILVLVPGVGYDTTGNRMGYGAGFYDRWFNRQLLVPCQDVIKLGVCFECQIVEPFQAEPLDIPVDAVVTENRKVVCNKEILNGYKEKNKKYKG